MMYENWQKNVPLPLSHPLNLGTMDLSMFIIKLYKRQRFAVIDRANAIKWNQRNHIGKAISLSPI